MKKGIALFSTLLIMTLVIALISMSLDALSKINKLSRADRELIQQNITSLDMKNFVDSKISPPLKALSQKETTKEYIDTVAKLLQEPISIKNPVNNNITTIILHPNSAKININMLISWLKLKNLSQGENDGYKIEFAENILKNLGIDEIELFTEIINANINTSSTDFMKKLNIDNIDSQYDLREYNQDCKSKTSSCVREEKIISWQQFYDIFAIYIANAKNKNLPQIKWENHFFIDDASDPNDTTKNWLDINYLRYNHIVLDAIPSSILSSTKKDSLKKTNNIIPYYKCDDIGINDEDCKKLRNINLDFSTKAFTCEINIKSSTSEVKYMFNYYVSTDNNNNQTRITYINDK